MTVRAAALVTLGMGVAGCDESPPSDLPGQAEARLDACRAAHRRLGEDPARCDILEQVIAREHGGSRPHFTTVAACETIFGRGACEGETLAATPPNWRPALAGWARAPENQLLLQPVVQDRAARLWALSEPVLPNGAPLATQAAPRNVQAVDVSPSTQVPTAAAYGYQRLAPIYPDEATCSAEWQRCERSDLALPNRYATREACQASWVQCVEVELPDSALTMAVADAAPVQGSGGSGSTRSGGGSWPAWWVGYNAGYRQNYAAGIGPRYQGWSWTADRRPTAAYRPATGTGPLQAWDSGTRRLDAANRMGGYSAGSGSRLTGAAVSRPTSSISRAGFGSTGASYSSGG
ncbi:DUF1190 domain-containing protein [Roseomonas sp. CAU 1739]|uniref:DUF1190 domain-containing protein n=1 Tax=Roseomonas sp. CAU 1739 TaxID=3140364 RepID=UPI00325A550A